MSATMDAATVLDNLRKFETIRNFIAFLEAKNLPNPEILPKVSAARAALDCALIAFAFDLQSHFEQSAVRLKAKKVVVSDELAKACEEIEFCGDKSLSGDLQDLLSFAKEYELNPGFTQQNQQDLKNLKKKILLIISERFW